MTREGVVGEISPVLMPGLIVSSVFCARLHEVKFFQVDLDYKSAEAEAAAAGGKKSTPEGDQMYCKENRHTLTH